MMTRRHVLCYAAAVAALPSQGAAYAVPVTILEAPYQTVAAVQRDLFPGGRLVPSPHLLKALEYFAGVMRDPYVDAEDKRFLVNGAAWLNEQAEKDFGRAYYRLPPEQRQRVLRTAADFTWGGNWLWNILSYLFEALLCDPVYGANTQEAGWHWLGHVPGYPRPEHALI